MIPARNEEGNLERLLGSLAHQQTAPAEVIVVDDRSTDATAALARRAGATVLAGTEPPPGWNGKCWACHQGAAAARGRRLVFLDADVTLSPDALGRLAADLERRGGLVSVAPFHHTERRYERLSAVANLVVLMGTGAFGVLPGSPTMAFGACMIVGADDYRRVGGHAHPDVRGAVAEDVALAGRFRALRLPVAVLAGREAVAFRMYPDGPRQLVDGWTRLLAAGAERTPVALAATIGLWVTAALLAASAPLRALLATMRASAPLRALLATMRASAPSRALLATMRASAPMQATPGTTAPLWATLGAVDRRQGGAARSPNGRTALAAYGAFSLQMWWMLRRVGRFGAVGTLAFPLPLSTFVALFARSAWNRLLGRPPTWRGRSMPATVSRPRS